MFKNRKLNISKAIRKVSILNYGLSPLYNRFIFVFVANGIQSW